MQFKVMARRNLPEWGSVLLAGAVVAFSAYARPEIIVRAPQDTGIAARG
jgi:hypothetical protein